MIPMKTSDGNPHYGSLHMRFCEVEFQRQQSRGARSLLHIRKWCVCVVVVLFASISAFGLTAMVDGIKWTYTVSNGKASVGGGTSSTPAVSTSTSGAITMPSKLGGYSVTSIGKYAFFNCTSLTSVTIPDSVTSIGSSAFYRCSGLSSVTIPDSVASIGSSAFSFCSGLSSVTIPDNVTSIGAYVFDGCSGLTSVTIPDSVTSIGNGAFRGCSGLTSVTIPDKVTSIGAYAFYGCSGLTSVTIPNTVTDIGSSTFNNCRGLTNVTIPNSVTNIGDSAFYSCVSLTQITIPSSVRSIAETAFKKCSGLRRVEMPRGWKNTIEAHNYFEGCSSDLIMVYVAADISNVVAKQRYPWNGKVDITFTLSGDMVVGLPKYNMPFLSITARDCVHDISYVSSAFALSGDTGTEEGVHHVIWDLDAQGLSFKSDEVVFTVTYNNILPNYCVIDLSGGKNATSYPVSYLPDVPKGGWTGDYKKTKLVLRLIDPMPFKMSGSYNVTLSKPFYVGGFEVTQKQYSLVTGSNPSTYGGDMRPVVYSQM